MTPRLDMIGLTVKNMAASIAFYRNLGLDIPEPQDGEPYVETTLSGGIRLSWNDLEMVKSIDPEWTEPCGQRVGLAFLCDSPAAVDALYEQLSDNGHKAPWDAFWGQRYAQIMDPDGNIVDLFAWLPKE